MLGSLPSDDFECHLVVPNEPPLRDELEAANVRIHIVPMARISTQHDAAAWVAYVFGWPLAVTRLVRLVRSLNIDVLHTNSLHSWYGWAAAALTRRPHVWHAREIVVQSPMALRIERFLTRHFATYVICMSDAIAQELAPTPAIVIRETADPAEFGPDRAGRFRAAEGIGDSSMLVGAAGRVDTWKGFDVLLEAFARVRTSRPHAELVIAGGAVPGKESLFEQLRDRAGEIPGVRWLGPRTDLPSLLADLDLFVLPSTEPEPYGLVVVEALASGVPTVVTDAGGPREIAADASPGSVVLVRPGDASALATGMLTVLDGQAASSTASRRARTSLRKAEPERFAELFRSAARRRRRRS
jgi:glycosyltransferase involved in cell wall biosynthesis